MKKPKVSVFVMVYNHAKFLHKCLDGILMQKGNFDLEIVVGEDCSTDNSREIILKYASIYTDKFKLILHKKNVGPGRNQIAILENCDGNYIAMCEGDDYWTSEHKLQEQIEFLESNPEYVMSFHDALVIHQNKGGKQEKFSEKFIRLKLSSTFTHKDIALEWFMPTASMVFRNKLFNKWPKWFCKVYSGDYTLQLLISRYGLIKYHDEIWCTHLKHEGGISQNIGLNCLRLNQRIYQLKKYIKHFDKEHKFNFSISLLELYRMKMKSKVSFFESVSTRINIIILRYFKQPYYYWQCSSIIDIKAKILTKMKA